MRQDSSIMCSLIHGMKDGLTIIKEKIITQSKKISNQPNLPGRKIQSKETQNSHLNERIKNIALGNQSTMILKIFYSFRNRNKLNLMKFKVNMKGNLNKI